MSTRTPHTRGSGPVSAWICALVVLIAVIASPAPTAAQPIADQAFVRAVYAGLLGRVPEPGGLDYWVGRLADGASRSAVLASIGDADEQRRLVVRDAYRSLLDRAPDETGLAFWSSGIIDRLTEHELHAQMSASTEFYTRAGGTAQGFVTDLYRRLLNREPEPAGLNFWVEVLDHGAPRHTIADAFLVSAEGIAQPGLSILDAAPNRGIAVASFDQVTIELDRAIDAETSAVIISVGGRRIGGTTQAVAGDPASIRFLAASGGIPSGAAHGPELVVVTVFAFDGSTVDRVDYSFSYDPTTTAILPAPTPPPDSGELMVAFYGHPTTGALGIAGEGSPDEALGKLVAQGNPYRASGRDIVPVFEMIATLVTANPGVDGLYRARSSESELRPFLDTIRGVDGRLILDIQPGRADVLDEARAFETLLLQPDVGLALDPEWVVGPDQTPRGRVGSLDAADINRVSAYLSNLARTNGLPPRILIIHRFQDSMVTNTDAVASPPGVRIIFHADGQGGPEAKIADYDTLMPPRFERGFKIFYDEDFNRLTPQQVLERLRPMPAFVSYQ